MRTPVIAGNWKMNTSVPEAVNLATELKETLDGIVSIEKILCPPFVSLFPVSSVIKGSTLKLGAQNIYFEDKGAFTGEISPAMLINMCQYTIIGHSERRQYFHETGEMISRKLLAAIKYHLIPILCVGENLSEYEAGRTKEVVTEQLAASLTGVDQADTLIIAYEPVWAIGTGKASSGAEANETISLIREIISARYDIHVADEMRILYGGSVTASNIEEFVSQTQIDGALVGGSSLKAREFSDIVKITAGI